MGTGVIDLCMLLLWSSSSVALISATLSESDVTRHRYSRGKTEVVVDGEPSRRSSEPHLLTVSATTVRATGTSTLDAASSAALTLDAHKPASSDP